MSITIKKPVIFSGRGLRAGFADQVFNANDDVVIVNHGLPIVVFQPFAGPKGDLAVKSGIKHVTVRECVKSFGTVQNFLSKQPGHRAALVRHGPRGCYTDWLGVIVMLTPEQGTKFLDSQYDLRVIANETGLLP